ncbi:MAG: hypothetical protein ABSG45_02980, partial [Nitrososphaerales archaeon]
VPSDPDVHVPYRQVAELAAVAPEGTVEEFVTKRLVANGAVKEASPELSTRIRWAARWARDANLRMEKVSDGSRSMVPEASQAWDAETVAALRAFAEALSHSNTSDEIQGAAFAAIRKGGTEPSRFFSAIYHILLGTDRGPRLGPYIMDAGQATISDRITKALEAGRYN